MCDTDPHTRTRRRAAHARAYIGLRALFGRCFFVVRQSILQLPHCRPQNQLFSVQSHNAHRRRGRGARAGCARPRPAGPRCGVRRCRISGAHVRPTEPHRADTREQRRRWPPARDPNIRGDGRRPDMKTAASRALCSNAHSRPRQRLTAARIWKSAHVGAQLAQSWSSWRAPPASLSSTPSPSCRRAIPRQQRTAAKISIRRSIIERSMARPSAAGAGEPMRAESAPGKLALGAQPP